MHPDDEHEIRRVLRDAAGPREMSHDVRARVLERLDRASGVPRGVRRVPDAPGHLERLDDALTTPMAPRRRRSRWAPVVEIAAAATVILLLATLVVSPGPTEAPTPPARADARGEPIPCPATWRQDHVDPLADALERWRGIENWAWSGGRPDLAELAQSALRAASMFEDPVISPTARAAQVRAVAELSSVNDGAIVDSSAAARARASAVEYAIDTVIEIGTAFGPSCGVERLEQWRS